MTRGTAALISPPVWTAPQLDADRQRAIAIFRDERIGEPLERYTEVFESYQGKVEDLLESTVDLSTLDQKALDLLGDPELTHALRYLAGPPISEDDLKVVAQVASLSARKLKGKPDDVARVVETIKLALDRRRFPWVSEDRAPTEAEHHAAVVASAALIAAQRVATDRRNQGKKEQEAAVHDALEAVGFTRVPAKDVLVVQDAPQPGEFCSEALFGPRKADVIIGLWDRRVMPIECKVSNSATNSIKRVRNDVAAKAVEWLRKFGANGVVPAAVLSGVYHLHHLQAVQGDGLTIFWAHNLAALTQWIESTRPAGKGKAR